MFQLEPYKKRHIKFITQACHDGWRFKVYGINKDDTPIPNKLTQQVLQAVPPFLSQPAVSEQRYGVGFITIHCGSLRNWILLDWWEQQDILHHRLFSSPLDSSAEITPELDRSLIACVHELRVVNFESEAWIKHALNDTQATAIDNYLNCRFEE